MTGVHSTKTLQSQTPGNQRKIPAPFQPPIHKNFPPLQSAATTSTAATFPVPPFSKTCSLTFLQQWLAERWLVTDSSHILLFIYSSKCWMVSGRSRFYYRSNDWWKKTTATGQMIDGRKQQKLNSRQYAGVWECMHRTCGTVTQPPTNAGLRETPPPWDCCATLRITNGSHQLWCSLGDWRPSWWKWQQDCMAQGSASP